jgi:hypothetical protein
VLRDAEGRELAHARSAEPYGVVDFSDLAARAAWQACFESLSRWQALWAPKSRLPAWSRRAAASRTCPGARIDSNWSLWWVPLPHVGGAPYDNYSFTVFIDSAKWAAASPGP